MVVPCGFGPQSPAPKAGMIDQLHYGTIEVRGLEMVLEIKTNCVYHGKDIV